MVVAFFIWFIGLIRVRSGIRTSWKAIWTRNFLKGVSLSTVCAWVLLVIAGLFEVVWSTFMKLSNGFSVPIYSILMVLGMIVSFVLLAFASKKLPIGIAYPVWTGIGALGSVLVGALLFKERYNVASCFSSSC